MSPASQPSGPRVRTALGYLVALFCAAMLGLAVGAAWMVTVMYLQRSPAWLALLAGTALGLATRRWLRRPGPAAATIAAVATLLAACYFNVLMATIRLAANFDMGLVDAMHTAGAGMLLELARIGLRPSDVVLYLVAALFAAALAVRPAHPPS